MALNNKHLFRICALLLAFMIVLSVSGCSDQVGPGSKPYLNIYGYPFFIVDSTGGRWLTDSNVVVQMSDGSSFHLKPGITEGYSNCFSWSVDDSTDATIHKIVFHVIPAGIKQISPSTVTAQVDYYPMVFNSADFLSNLPIQVGIWIDSTK